MSWSCKRCGGCCNPRNFLVLMTTDCAAEIAARGHKNFCKFQEVRNTGFLVANENGSLCSVLPILAARGNEETRCIFLSDRRLCEIYEYRPPSCRTFPFVSELLCRTYGRKVGRPPVRLKKEIELKKRQVAKTLQLMKTWNGMVERLPGKKPTVDELARFLGLSEYMR